MADNREDAMKEAIKMSDSMKNEKHGTDSKIKLQVPDGVANIINQFREKVMNLWAKRYGRATIIGGGVAFIFFIILLSMSSCSGSAPVPAEREQTYNLSDAVLCVYEDNNTQSGVAYDAFVEITNTGNLPVIIEQPSFSIDTDDGTHVFTDNNIRLIPEVILPGEKGYMFSDFGTELENISNKNATFTLSPSFAVTEVNDDEVIYNISDEELSTFNTDTYVDFTVEGKGGILPSNVNAYAVIYNSKGRCMGFGEANLMNLNESEGEAEVKITDVIKGWAGEEPAQHKIYVRENKKEE